jgi:tol-pal system protein YbgF
MPITPLPGVRRTLGNPRGGRPGRGVRLALTAALLVPLAACATKRDVRDLTEEVRRLNTQQEQLLQEMHRDQRALRDSIRLLSAGQGELRGDLLRRLVDLQEDFLTMGEVVGISQQQLSQIRDQLVRERSTLGGEMGGFQETPGEGQAQDIYNDALTQLRRGNLSTARFGFEELVERFPQHELTPEARYLLADILAREGAVEEAIEAFLLVRTYHPTAERVPDALYRVGMLYVELGQVAEGRGYLERVVTTWPDSGAAELAAEALRELG